MTPDEFKQRLEAWRQRMRDLAHQYDKKQPPKPEHWTEREEADEDPGRKA